LGGDLSHAVSPEVEAVCIVNETVENGVGDGWVGDDLVLPHIVKVRIFQHNAASFCGLQRIAGSLRVRIPVMADRHSI